MVDAHGSHQFLTALRNTIKDEIIMCDANIQRMKNLRNEVAASYWEGVRDEKSLIFNSLDKFLYDQP